MEKNKYALFLRKQVQFLKTNQKIDNIAMEMSRKNRTVFNYDSCEALCDQEAQLNYFMGA
jgi:hypothetical protein